MVTPAAPHASADAPPTDAAAAADAAAAVKVTGSQLWHIVTQFRPRPPVGKSHLHQYSVKIAIRNKQPFPSKSLQDNNNKLFGPNTKSSGSSTEIHDCLNQHSMGPLVIILRGCIHSSLVLKSVAM